MKIEDPSIQQRLRAFELADALGNVSEACRQVGVSRSQFYLYRQRFQEQGLVGLANRPPVPKSHPFTTSEEAVERVRALSLAHPTWGCGRISRALAEEGCALSSPTVQKILIRHGLGQRADRLAALERRHFQEGIALDAEQVAALERANPCFRDRHAPSPAPGARLWQDVFPAGRIDYVGRLYLHAVVDICGGYAFAHLAASAAAEPAIALLRDGVLPYYKERRLPVCAIEHAAAQTLAASGAYERFLAAGGVAHRPSAADAPGCFERFRLAVKAEFLEDDGAWAEGASVGAVGAALSAWLADYNSRPHPGYPTFGLSPLDVLARTLDIRVEEGDWRSSEQG